MDSSTWSRWIRVFAVVAAVVVSMGVADTASAQYVDDTEDVRFDESSDNAYQIVGRFRTVGIPNFLLNAFYDRHSANWRNGTTNFGYGLEFVWRKVDAFELSVAAEYADLQMPRDWWKESGKSDAAADYVDFDLGLASLVFSGYWYWDVAKWFSPYVGGGLGLGMVLGDITKYNPREDSGCRSSLEEDGSGGSRFGGDACYDGDEVDYQNDQKFEREIEDSVWPVAPVVNITTGARFNIGRNGVVKLEVGFYDYLFAGLSAGAQWR